MPVSVSDVVELIGPDRAVRFGSRERVGETARVTDVIVWVGIGNRRHLDQFRPRKPQHVLLFLGLGVGDHDDGPVAERARHHRDADAGVAGRALDHDAAGTEIAALDRIVDDRERRAILDRPSGIHELGLAENRAAGRFGGGPEPDERRAADRADDIGVEFHRASSDQRLKLGNRAPCHKPRLLRHR